ncbi:hypothetical protein F4859DRAFT_518736 [Xylaria cf. heliscus]|nr:hypothetical protein F4859DRAFT_518736 [Xylaria cf. heliscus]
MYLLLYRWPKYTNITFSPLPPQLMPYTPYLNYPFTFIESDFNFSMDVVFTRLVYGPDGYSFTIGGRGSIPQMFRDMTIGSVYVEFLRLDDSSTPANRRNFLKNHAIIKIDFTSRYGNIKHETYKGARINFQSNVQISNGAYQPGELFVKPTQYLAASHNTARTCQIDFREGITLDHFLWLIEKNNLQYFSFVVLNNKYYGCRDFM